MESAEEDVSKYVVEKDIQNHKMFEGMLKKMFDKLKFHLCLKFPNDSYDVVLNDGLVNDAYILAGDIVTIKIKTKLFSDIITRNGKPDEFRQLMEHCLRQVVRMQITLTHTPPADVLYFDEEKRRFSKITQAEYNKLHPRHPYEGEIHYDTDFRTTAIHWKAGVVVREFGKSTESSRNNARRRILTILNDPEIYNRVDDEFLTVESHDDIIHDYLIQAKVFSKPELHYIITQLNTLL